MYTIYSMFWTILNCSLMAVILILLRRKTTFLQKYGTSALMLLIFCCAVRMLIPLEFPNHQYIIHSDFLYPLIQEASDHFRLLKVFAPQIFGFWILGSLIFLSVYLSRYAETYQLIHTDIQPAPSHIYSIMYEIDAACRLPIYIAPLTPVPLLARYWHTAIYLPNYDYSEEDLYYILLHEYTHWKRHDLLKKLLLNMFYCFFWWNPFMYLLANEFTHLSELNCDHDLAKQLTDREIVSYLESCLKTATSMMVPSKALSSQGMPLILPKKNSSLKQRFDLLLYQGQSGHFIVKAFLIFGIILWMISSYYFLPQPYYEKHTTVKESNIDYYQDVSYYNSEESYIEETEDGHFYLHSNGETIELLKEAIPSGTNYSEYPIIQTKKSILSQIAEQLKEFFHP